MFYLNKDVDILEQPLIYSDGEMNMNTTWISQLTNSLSKKFSKVKQ